MWSGSSLVVYLLNIDIACSYVVVVLLTSSALANISSLKQRARAVMVFALYTHHPPTHLSTLCGQIEALSAQFQESESEVLSVCSQI